MSQKKLIVLPDGWVEAIEAKAGKRQVSAYIKDAVAEKYLRETGEKLPAPRPDGVRRDSRPTGWRSTIFRDVYQIAVTFSGDDAPVIQHYHMATLPDIKPITLKFAAGEAVGDWSAEVYIYNDSDKHIDEIKDGLTLEIPSFIFEEGFEDERWIGGKAYND